MTEPAAAGRVDELHLAPVAAGQLFVAGVRLVLGLAGLAHFRRSLGTDVCASRG